MQKLLSVIMLILIIIAPLTGCQTKSSAVSVKSTIDTGFQPYYEMSDGSWQCDGRTYQYRLEISGDTAGCCGLHLCISQQLRRNLV